MQLITVIINKKNYIHLQRTKEWRAVNWLSLPPNVCTRPTKKYVR